MELANGLMRPHLQSWGRQKRFECWHGRHAYIDKHGCVYSLVEHRMVAIRDQK